MSFFPVIPLLKIRQYQTVLSLIKSHDDTDLFSRTGRSNRAKLITKQGMSKDVRFYVILNFGHFGAYAPFRCSGVQVFRCSGVQVRFQVFWCLGVEVLKCQSVEGSGFNDILDGQKGDQGRSPK